VRRGGWKPDARKQGPDVAKPNADVGDILSIWDYALSVDGY